MKAYISEDEWYPVYSVTDSNNEFGVLDQIEIDPELFDTIKKAEKVFRHYQTVLKEIHWKQV